MKGLTIHDLLPAIIVVVVIALAGSFAATIVSSIQSGQCNTSVAGGGWNTATGACYANSTTTASNITGYGMVALLNMEQQLPNLALILIVAVIIGVLVGSFIVYQARKE